MERASVYDAEDGAFHEDVITQRINHLLQQNPHDAYAHLFLGDLQASRDAYQEASALYAQAIAYDPTLAHGYYSLGVIYDKSGAPHKALEMYEQAVQHADSSLLYWNNLAGQYFRLQNYSKAIATYEQTLKRDGDFLLPYFDMAACFRVLGQFEQARQYQQQGVARLDTPQIAAQEKNQQPWYFNLGEQHITLDTLPRKQCYAYRSLGATLQALHRSAEAAQYERKPCALHSVDMEAIQTWVQLEALSMDRVPTKS